MCWLTSRNSNLCNLQATRFAARPRAVVVLARAASSNNKETSYSIHGRHVDVTDEVEKRVKERLSETFKKFMGGQYLEAEGGIEEVDVRLM